MTIDLPSVVATYFAADRDNEVDAMLGCFARDAVVRDERRTHSGLEEIRRWKADASAKYSYTCVPFSCAKDGERTVVTSHLEGDFPGSPVDLRYFFLLREGKIAELEIVP